MEKRIDEILNEIENLKTRISELENKKTVKKKQKKQTNNQPNRHIIPGVYPIEL